MKKIEAMDGNSAAAHVAHACNEVIAIYPITPSSPMGEIADEKSADGEKNIWGTVPDVVELQSEAGASASVHGSLASGALSTTFTASQGLLLMIPNMHKIAAELLPTVFHIAARSLAAHALSIFGDHQDVMNCRTTGFCMMPSGSVQESMDIAMISTAASLECSLPFLHFFDGFRTSHEVQKIEVLDQETMREMIEDRYVIEHREKALSPDHPMISGTSQNPDVYFQGRERANPYYEKVPEIVEKYMRKFEDLTGRKYEIFQYFGDEEAEKVVILMGSGVDTAQETVEVLNSQGHKLGLIKVRLYRPFSTKHLVEALPRTVRSIAVLDRTKEPGSLGEPLYLDVVSSIDEMLEEGTAPFEDRPTIVGGRYGLSSKEFTPGMLESVLKNLDKSKPKNHFTVGIHDDVSHTSLEWDEELSKVCGSGYEAMFWGLGSDGTVSANKNTIKIISEATDKYAQGYFVYDSKKAGNRTTSHVRFSDLPIRSAYLCKEADFVGCHNWSFLEKYDMLKYLKEGGTFLLNSPYSSEEVWQKLPKKIQKQLIERDAIFFVIDAQDLAEELYLGSRINTIMQTAFFELADIIPMDEAVELIKKNIEESYGKKGRQVVERNFEAVERALKNLERVEYPRELTADKRIPPTVSDDAPEFVKEVTAKMMELEGNKLRVSQMPPDAQWPTGTTQYEKRNIAHKIPVWRKDICIQCGLCSLVCPHSTIRMKIYDSEELDDAPKHFKHVEARSADGKMFTVQVAPEDCTGCQLCVNVCPGKKDDKRALYMDTQYELREKEAEDWEFFLELPETDPSLFDKGTIKGSQLIKPLFEFCGACSGCGETPYIKLVTQLVGDRALIGNATGCSSIYGGNLPTTPYCKTKDGYGPAWTNSLFEDAAEIGYGFSLTANRLMQQARERLEQVDYVPEELRSQLLKADMSDDQGIGKQRKRVKELKKLAEENQDEHLKSLADYLVKKSIWIFGGDGWAYDIGFGGLDHVMASGNNVNALVLDTEVYSNTGGQMSKSTPRASTAKFAAAGKNNPKKDLGMMLMSYGYVYVAQVSLGANPAHTVKAIKEAEEYGGPSVVLCYTPCIAHGIRMSNQLDEQKKAVQSGHWLLYRYDPRRAEEGKNPLQLDSKEPTIPIEDFIYNENRFRILKDIDEERAEQMARLAQKDVDRRWNLYKQMSEMDYSWMKNKGQ